MMHGDKSWFQLKELILSPPYNDQNYGLWERESGAV